MTIGDRDICVVPKGKIFRYQSEMFKLKNGQMFAITVSQYHKTITGQDGISWEWLHQCGGLWCPSLLLKNRLVYIHSQITDRLKHTK